MSMDAIDRTLMTLAFEKPDRLPTDLHNFQPAAAAMGVPLQEAFRDGDLPPASQLKAWRTFGRDVLILESGRSSSVAATKGHSPWR